MGAPPIGVEAGALWAGRAGISMALLIHAVEGRGYVWPRQTPGYRLRPAALFTKTLDTLDKELKLNLEQRVENGALTGAVMLAQSV